MHAKAEAAGRTPLRKDQPMSMILEFLQPLRPHDSGVPIPTPHRQGAGVSDSVTRPSAVFEDEVVLEEFEQHQLSEGPRKQFIQHDRRKYQRLRTSLDKLHA